VGGWQREGVRRESKRRLFQKSDAFAAVSAARFCGRPRLKISEKFFHQVSRTHSTVILEAKY
jgi:hypothetical protein